jgi:hypothetical protein
MIEWFLIGVVAAQGIAILVLTLRQANFRADELAFRRQAGMVVGQQQDLLAQYDVRLQGLGSRGNGIVPTWDEMQEQRWKR